jgi:hypothetical protein
LKRRTHRMTLTPKLFGCGRVYYIANRRVNPYRANVRRFGQVYQRSFDSQTLAEEWIYEMSVRNEPPPPPQTWRPSCSYSTELQTMLDAAEPTP